MTALILPSATECETDQHCIDEELAICCPNGKCVQDLADCGGEKSLVLKAVVGRTVVF